MDIKSQKADMVGCCNNISPTILGSIVKYDLYWTIWSR